MYKTCSLYIPGYSKIKTFSIQADYWLMLLLALCLVRVLGTHSWVEKFRNGQLKWMTKNTTDIIFNEFGAKMFHLLTPTNSKAHKKSFWRGQEEVMYRWAQAWWWNIITWHFLVINDHAELRWKPRNVCQPGLQELSTPPPAPGEPWESDKVQDKSMKVCH